MLLIETASGPIYIDPKHVAMIAATDNSLTITLSGGTKVRFDNEGDAFRDRVIAAIVKAK